MGDDQVERIVCARCGGELPQPDSAVVVCPACGHPHAAEYLDELVALDRLEAWVPEQRAWLRAELVAGRLPGPPVGAAPGPASAPRPGPSVGTVLLVVGALALVAAGIAFVALAWDRLGPIGQVLTVLAAGLLGIGGATRIPERLRATAETVGIAGAGLVVVASVASRVLGDDPLGPSRALTAACAIGAVLLVLAVVVRRPLPVCGEVAGTAAVLLLVVLLASAPASDAIPLDEPWTWWIAAVLLTGGVLAAGVPSPFRAFGWLGAGLLLVGGGAGADAAQSIADAGPALEPLLAGAGLIVVAIVCGALGAARRERSRPLLIAASLLVVLASFGAVAAGIGSPEARPAALAVLIAVSVVVVAAPRALEHEGLVVGRLDAPHVDLAVACGVGGAGIAFLAAPWRSFPTGPAERAALVEWLTGSWTAWRAVVALVAVVLVVLVSVLVVDRRLRGSRPWGAATTAATSAFLAVWLLCAFSATQQYADEGFPAFGFLDVRTLLVTVAVVAGGAALSLLLGCLLRALPRWDLVGAAVVGTLAVVVALVAGRVDDPDVWAVVLAVPAAVAGAGAGWLSRAEPLPTWVTAAPGLSIALGSATVVVAMDAVLPSSIDGDGRYQIRVVVLLAVGLGCALVGARQRLAGVFWPGAVCVVLVVLTQLVEVSRFVPQWVSLAVVGLLLVLAGARWEDVRTGGRRTRQWAVGMR